jgi:hypothetical protein
MTKRMSLMVAVILVVVVLGVGGYLMTRSPKPAPKQAVTQEQTTVPPTETPVPAQKSSLKDLLAQKKDVVCEANYPDQQSTGTVYLSSPKFRGDFTVTLDNQPTQTHLVSDGATMYMWSDGSDRGTKMKLDLEQIASSTASAQNQAVDLNKEVDIKCNPWTVDATKFTPPTTVQFTDLSSVLKNPSKSGLPSLDKSVCDKIADPTAKAACLKALGG